MIGRAAVRREYRQAADATEAATVLAAINYPEPIRGCCINTFGIGEIQHADM